MDEFVCNKLNEWGLGEFIELFKDHGIDKEGLYCLDDLGIALLFPKVGPRSKFKKRLKLLKQQNPETVDSSVQVCPSTSDTHDKEKRKLDQEGECSKSQSPARKRRLDTGAVSYSERFILSDVKTIMRCVLQKLPQQDNKLNKFLKEKIRDLETDKREVVGVFGKTGAGKSSLINAVIGEKNLLPSGRVSACTSVMIKVEANTRNSKYEADIEFITKEEWQDELWSFHFLRDNADQEGGQEAGYDYRDSDGKLSALYGKEWENKSPENLMDDKYFKEIPEFRRSDRKLLTCESAKELSAKFVKYTRNNANDGEDREVKRWYWPLVKCVTVRVPHNDLLQHVTLVDLPGTGDCNKSRDNMWKGVVGSCSTVWIVTDINRAASEKEPWEILENASSYMGNGGECQHIHFICTKSDAIDDLDEHTTAAGVRESLLKQNNQVKREVSQKLREHSELRRHFSDECYEVFTVSSKEFLKKKHLSQDDTEIPKLQEFLRELNDCHSETLNYLSGAHGILSLIQGASRREGADKKRAVFSALEKKMRDELDKIKNAMEMSDRAFERCLSDGVEKSKSSYGKVLKSVLHPINSGSGYHGTLKCVVKNNGTYKTGKGKLINLNMKLASCLTDSIDEEFKKTFPNEGTSGPFNGVINEFSLVTKSMMGENTTYRDVQLQLIFLKTEEEKIRVKLNKIIRHRKKMIYSSLTTTIEEAMKDCYDRAKEIRGANTLKNLRDTIANHVHKSKDVMFQQAKDVMLKQLRDLKEDILQLLEKTMQESIDLSLKTDGVSLPDVAEELRMVKRYNLDVKLQKQ